LKAGACLSEARTRGGVASLRNETCDHIPPPPPVGKRSCWLILSEGLVADFRPKIEFFVFVLRNEPPEASFSLFYFPCLILNIGENIKKYRTKQGLSQEDFARKSSVKYITLTKIEIGALL